MSLVSLAAPLGCIADREPRPWNAALANGINYRAAVTSMLSAADGRNQRRHTLARPR